MRSGVLVGLFGKVCVWTVRLGVDKRGGGFYFPGLANSFLCFYPEARAMKVVSSLKSMKKRHKDCRVVRRKGRVYVICKSNPRFKARHG